MVNRFLKALTRFIQQQWLKKGLFSTLLFPLSLLSTFYAHQKRQRYLQGKTYTPSVPVIIVGNIFVGGTGKTPLTIALVQALIAHGYTPGIVSRGYGVKLDAKQARLVSPSDLDHYPNLANIIGDEPSLLAKFAPIAVHPQRVLAVKTLMARYPHIDVIISDDGLQHYALGRYLEIIVQDERKIGNGYLLPAGPLREPPSRLQTVDFIVTNYNHKTPPALSSSREIGMSLHIKTLENVLTGECLSLEDFKERFTEEAIYAIAGIGNPSRFYASLQAQQILLSGTKDFTDHHDFSREDFASFPKGIILMTSKDASKCRTFAQENWWFAHLDVQFIPHDFFQHLIQRLRHFTA